MSTPRPSSKYPASSRNNGNPTASSDGIARLLESALDDAVPTPTLSPVRLVTASSEVADRLMTAIALGEYLPEQRLPPERQLASILSVSRPVVREALARLHGAGIIEIRRGRSGGAYVRASWSEASADAIRHTLLPRWDEFEHLLDLRALIEDLVGRVAAERATSQQRAAIGVELELYRNAADPAEEQAADSAFHGAILTATNNPQLFQLSRTLLASTSLAFPFEPWGSEQDLDRTEFLRALTDHEAIYAAICSHDVDEAGRLSRDHFGITSETFHAVVARAQSDESAPPIQR